MSKRRTKPLSGKQSHLEETLLNKGEKDAFYAIIEDDTAEESTRTHKCRRRCYLVTCNSGTICISLMFIVFAMGITLFGVTHSTNLFPEQINDTASDEKKKIIRVVSSFVIYGGLFGALGGLSNCLVLVLMFFRIPLLYGTGIIQRHYTQISDVLRKVILQMLFDNEHIERYFLEKLNRFAVDTDIVQCIQTAISSRTAEKIINDHLNRLYEGPDAYYLNILGVTKERLKPMIAPSLLSLCAETAPFVLEKLNQRHSTNAISVPDIREAMDRFLHYRVNDLTCEKVAKFIRNLMYRHFIVLISYGCLMGFIVGLIAQALRFTLNPEFVLEAKT